MLIAIIADPIDNQNAGVYFYTHRLIENLLKIDKKNRYVFIHLRKNTFFKDKNHFIIPRKKILGYGTYRKFFLIPRLLRHLKPDIVWEPCHIGPFRTPKNCKRVVTIHDLTPILFPQFHIFQSTIIHKLLLKRVVCNADLILTASQTTKKDISERYHPKGQINVIPLGIDPPKANPPRPKIQKPYFLYLGTIEPRKNLITLINAFKGIKRDHKIPHQLVLAGEIGWKNLKTIKLAQQKDIITTGYLTDQQKASYYKHTTAFVYPSLYEGFGLPPLEAMSYRIPVICSNGGSLGEIFKDHALLFSPLDQKKLEKLMMEIVKNPNFQQKIINKAFQFSQSFRWQKTASKTLQAFQNLF